MSFLDNSGDIILDAVLTDTGRLRLAQGDGSFKITKFALGDDEINYGSYDKNHASGSAYYDLQILQTPVFEAFTNNTSNLNTKLMSISRTNLLYMPTLKLNKCNDTEGLGAQQLSSFMYRRSESGAVSMGDLELTKYVIAVDDLTYKLLTTKAQSTAGWDKDSGDTISVNNSATTAVCGVIKGYTSDGSGGPGGVIRLDQGLATNQISPTAGLDSDLYESQYIVEMDYRLGRVKPQLLDTAQPVNFIDDDNIATYYLTTAPYVYNNPSVELIEGSAGKVNGQQVFAGPRGSTLMFRIHASTELQYSNYLFTQIGSSEDTDGASNVFGFKASADARTDDRTTYYIDTTIRVFGANTGFRMDIPVRYVKIE